jgi:hypothetical protein
MTGLLHREVRELANSLWSVTAHDLGLILHCRHPFTSVVIYLSSGVARIFWLCVVEYLTPSPTRGGFLFERFGN